MQFVALTHETALRWLPVEVLGFGLATTDHPAAAAGDAIPITAAPTRVSDATAATMPRRARPSSIRDTDRAPNTPRGYAGNATVPPWVRVVPKVPQEHAALTPPRSERGSRRFTSADIRHGQ